MPNSIDFCKGIFLHVVLVRIIVPCLKLSKNFPQTKHVSQMTSLQKLLKSLHIVIVKNFKIVSMDTYKKIRFKI